MSTTEKVRTKTKARSFSKGEFQILHAGISAVIGMQQSQAELEGLALVEMNKRLRPFEEIRTRLMDAIQEFREGE